MTKVRFPFWIVVDRLPETDALRSPCDDPKAIQAFSSGDKVVAYLAGREVGTWKVSLVNDRNALVLAIADAHQHGSVTVRLDSQNDGSGGQPADITHLLDM